MNAISACRRELLKTQRSMERLKSKFGYVENGKEMARLANYAKVCLDGIQYLENLRADSTAIK